MAAEVASSLSGEVLYTLPPFRNYRPFVYKGKGLFNFDTFITCVKEAFPSFLGVPPFQSYRARTFVFNEEGEFAAFILLPDDWFSE